jgi:hypothetical protein
MINKAVEKDLAYNIQQLSDHKTKCKNFNDAVTFKKLIKCQKK